MSAKVSHQMTAELAHAFVEEVKTAFGDASVFRLQSSKILEKMSRAFATGHSASITRAALEAMPKVVAPLPISDIDVGLEERHPCIFLSDYVRALADMGQLEILTGGRPLGCVLEFWQRFQPLRPTHPVFELPAAELASTIPIYLIADEGRGYKKSAIMVLGSEPLLGTGCEAQDETTAAETLKLNFKGNTLKTRQLFSVMAKQSYRDDSAPLDALLAAWAANLAEVFTAGVHVNGQCIRLAPIAFKGDWPALIQVGSLHRNFRKEAHPFGSGLCHLCMANTRECPS